MPLGLVLHELVTNAVKYGAWSNHGGLIRVTWNNDDGRLHLLWQEYGGQATAQGVGSGFGTQLIDSSARQLHGSIARTTTSEGLEVRMTLPLDHLAGSGKGA